MIVFWLIFSFVAAIMIAQDAKKRGMSPMGWGWFTFLVWPLAIILYVVVREPRAGG